MTVILESPVKEIPDISNEKLDIGFKRSEVGIIPEDWEVKLLGDLVCFLDGKRRPIKDSDRAKIKGVFPYYGASGIIDYVNDYLFDEKLILLGEDGENILSRNCRLAFKISGKAWVNNHAHVLKPNSDIDMDYLTEYLESLDYEKYNTGTAQPKLNKKVCWSIPVIVPPLKEQQAIATALSDIDSLINSLDQLIVKKRNIKLATMQQLLTGKQRLPGFSGEWDVKKLEELCQLNKGSQINKSLLEAVGEFPVWNGGISPSGYTNKWNTKENTITISEGGNSCGFVNFSSQRFWCGGHCYSVCQIKQNIDHLFLFQKLRTCLHS